MFLRKENADVRLPVHLTEFADADVSFGISQYSVTDMLLSKTSDQAFIEAKEIVDLIAYVEDGRQS